MNEFNDSDFTDEMPGRETEISPEELKQSPKDRIKSVSWQDAGGVHNQTTIIHKNVPSVWTILITAITFLLIGALVATSILAARFFDFADLMPDHNADAENPDNTNPPLITAPPVQNPDGNENGNENGNGNGNENGNSGSVFNGENPIPALYNDVVDGVVIVKAYSSTNKSKYDVIGVGSGFFISQDGYILTNAHVVKDALSVWVVLHDGKEVQTKIVGSDMKSDVAVLKIDAASCPKALRIGNSSKVAIGDFVFAVGHPTGEELSFTLTFGTVGAVGRPVLIDGISNTYIQVDAAINPGNSGGPLFNMKGEVVGINSAKTIVASYDEHGKTISAEGLGFALPINDAMDVAKQIISDGSVDRPGIGVSVITIDEEMAAKFNVPQGVLVYSVIKDGPAHKAGLYADDIIVKANGTEITDNDAFVNVIQKLKIGDSVEIEFWRKGEKMTCTLVIGNFNDLGTEILDNAYGGGAFGIMP